RALALGHRWLAELPDRSKLQQSHRDVRVGPRTRSARDVRDSLREDEEPERTALHRALPRRSPETAESLPCDERYASRCRRASRTRGTLRRDARRSRERAL